MLICDVCVCVCVSVVNMCCVCAMHVLRICAYVMCVCVCVSVLCVCAVRVLCICAYVLCVCVCVYSNHSTRNRFIDKLFFDFNSNTYYFIYSFFREFIFKLTV